MAGQSYGEAILPGVLHSRTAEYQFTTITGYFEYVTRMRGFARCVQDQGELVGRSGNLYHCCGAITCSSCAARLEIDYGHVELGSGKTGYGFLERRNPSFIIGARLCPARARAPRMGLRPSSAGPLSLGE